MTDRTVPTEPTPEMIEAGRWGGMPLDENRCINIAGIYRAMLAASPAAPGAEVEPVAEPYAWEFSQLMHDSMGGWERKIQRTKPGTWVKPEDIEDLRPLYLSPPTTDAIRAQARREVLELAADEAYRVVRQWASEAFARDTAASIRALAGKPGEAEGWRPISEAKTDGTEYWVYVAAAHDLPAFQCMCSYHPDAGWCADELREVTHFRPLPTPPSAQGGGDGE